MKGFRGVHYLLSFILVFGVLIGLCGGQRVLAAEEEPPEEPPEEKLELVSSFPVQRGESGTSFEFEVMFNYQGSEPKVFEFALAVPQEWQASVRRTWGEENVASLLAIRLIPNKEYPDRAKVVCSPLPGSLPEPGDYVVTLEAVSGSLRDSIELKAVVTGLPEIYGLDLVTPTGRLDIPVKAGEDNPVSFLLTNTGTGTLENITFTSVKSEGWGTTFSPSRIKTFAPGQSQEIEVVITPPRRTIAGDYHVIMRAMGVVAVGNIDLRVRVQTPTVWGGVGIGIVAAVIAGLAVLFRRLGRR